MTALQWASRKGLFPFPGVLVVSLEPFPKHLFPRGNEFAWYMHSPLLFFFLLPLCPYQGTWWSAALILEESDAGCLLIVYHNVELKENIKSK